MLGYPVPDHPVDHSGHTPSETCIPRKLQETNSVRSLPLPDAGTALPDNLVGVQPILYPNACHGTPRPALRLVLAGPGRRLQPPGDAHRDVDRQVHAHPHPHAYRRVFGEQACCRGGEGGFPQGSAGAVYVHWRSFLLLIADVYFPARPGQR